MLAPAGRAGLSAELVGDRRHRGAGHRTARKVLAVVGWAGYSVPPAVGKQRLLRRHRRAGSFARITPTGDINPKTIGRTTFSASNGWLYAVVQDTTTDDLRGQGVFVSQSGNPAGPWTRIADTDKLAASGRPSATRPARTTRASSPTTTRTSWPTRPTASTSTCSSRRSSSRPTAARPGSTVGPYWNYDISCDPNDDDPYDCPPTTHPDQHAGMIYNGQFWAGNDGGVWRRPLTWHTAGTGPTSTPPCTRRRTTRSRSARSARRPGLLGRPAGQRRVLHPHEPARVRAGVHR